MMVHGTRLDDGHWRYWIRRQVMVQRIRKRRQFLAVAVVHGTADGQSLLCLMIYDHLDDPTFLMSLTHSSVQGVDLVLQGQKDEEVVHRIETWTVTGDQGLQDDQEVQHQQHLNDVQP